MGGCAALLPDVTALTENTVPSPPGIVGPEGKLTEMQARAVLSREQQGVNAEELIMKTVALMESVGGHSLTAGNKITLLIDGPATYEAMFRTIESAKDHINFETYIFSDDEVGRKFADLMIRKQAEGVQVNLLYDAVGSISTPDAFFQRLGDAGLNVLEFNPVNPLKIRKKLLTIQRDHRKVVVIDGKIAFTGGVNISSVYYGSSSSMSRQPGGSKESWRDTHMKIEGPAVAELQRSFIQTWDHQKGPPLADRNYFPKLEARGKALAQVIPSLPGETNRLTYVMYVAAIKNARNSIRLTTPYFVPDRQMRKAIIEAAKRGVEVRIVLPGSSDSNLIINAGRSFYSDLLQSGVRLYEFRDRMVHAKTAVIDGVWSTVGSTNLDLQSFLHNNEINVIVIGKDFAGKMEEMFAQDVAASDEVTDQKWSQRPGLNRIKEFLARLLAPWL
ncbi:MAG: cardiolipin synthase [Deltaproteobacteria bacterium]|nr:cardiolipin synthase [Deltaproteobacteria bacterium]